MSFFIKIEYFFYNVNMSKEINENNTFDVMFDPNWDWDSIEDFDSDNREDPHIIGISLIEWIFLMYLPLMRNPCERVTKEREITLKITYPVKILLLKKLKVE